MISRQKALWAGVGLLVAVLPCAWMRGFTVDDALIAVRYARHLASGVGYRFNAEGPSTDGVTPLPWAFLLAPFARGSALDVLQVAKIMGWLAWAAASCALGIRAGRTRSFVPLAVLALSLPVAAHAVSGMETGIAMGLATAASLCAEKHPRASALLAGLTAAFRPEMAPWAMVVGAGAAWAGRQSKARVFSGLVLALAPFLICVVVRLIAFGRAAPLAVMAKPSDLSHGAIYAASAILVSGTPLLVMAPIALWRASRPAKVVAFAALVHVLVVIAVGGDWMPYARLMAPIAPSLALCAMWLDAHRAATVVRGVIAVAVSGYVFLRAGAAGRGVQRDRAELIESVRPLLAGRASVAALDVGWVSAATEARIVDLAGLTDPEIAALPGGHTSKRVDPGFLLSKHPDALLFYVQEDRPQPTRIVEDRLVRSSVIQAHFEERAFLPLGPKGAGYLLLVAK